MVIFSSPPPPSSYNLHNNRSKGERRTFQHSGVLRHIRREMVALTDIAASAVRRASAQTTAFQEHHPFGRRAAIVHVEDRRRVIITHCTALYSILYFTTIEPHGSAPFNTQQKKKKKEGCIPSCHPHRASRFRTLNSNRRMSACVTETASTGDRRKLSPKQLGALSESLSPPSGQAAT